MALVRRRQQAYVALNGYNTLGVIDTAARNTLVKQIPVGNAPRQVVLDGNKARLQRGRPAGERPSDFTNLSDGTADRLQPVDRRARSPAPSRSST